MDLIVGLALWAAMVNATRGVADAADPALDEMLTRIRDSYRSRAYRLLAICVIVGCIVLVSLTANTTAWGITFTPTNGIVEAVVGPLYLLSFGLPTLLASWSVPDIDQPADCAREGDGESP